MKAKVEWKENDCWKQANVEVGYSRNNNYWFKHNGAVYVFPLLKDGTEVVKKTEDGKWAKAGRVAFGCIFLGDGLTYSETNTLRFQNQKFERPIYT